MRSLTALSEAELLALWERGSEAPAPARGPLVLEAVGERSEGVSLGACNRALVALHVHTYGSADVEALVHCPRCAELLELQVTMPSEAGRESGELRHDGRVLSFRCPRVDDVTGGSAAGSREALARRCLGAVDVEVSEALLDALERAVVAADPMVAPGVEVACAACDHAWVAPVDPGAFVWERVEARARHILVEVRDLAMAYGWSPTQSLSLGRRARRTLLELAGR